MNANEPGTATVFVHAHSLRRISAAPSRNRKPYALSACCINVL